MKPVHSFFGNRSARLAALLALAILFAQWMGLQHRIEHGERTDLYSAFSVPDDNSVACDATTYADANLHSCALFDGITLADSAPLPAFSLLLDANSRIRQLRDAFRSWEAPFLSWFYSRAPPLTGNSSE